MSADRDFDVVVIGGGSGGYAAARSSVEHGLQTAVIEGGEEVGGLCILRGCMPTKALLYSAEVAHLSRSASIWGVGTGEVKIDFRAVMARKDRLISEFAGYRRDQLQDGRFEFVRGMARFVDPHTVEVNGRRISAESFVVSTGSRVSSPPFGSLERVGYLTSDDALSLQELPESMIVLGGGPIALEFAQFFLRMGVRVTLIQRSAQVLSDSDPDVAEALVDALRAEGMQVFTGTELKGFRAAGNRKQAFFMQGGREIAVTADEILFALGRSPNTEGLGLDAISVKTKRGRIIADAQMRTSVPSIYAAGDCTGPYEIVHVAIQQGEIAAWNIAHPDKPRSIDYRLKSSIAFTDPQVATVGLSEREARAAGRDVIAASYPFNDHGKSMIMEAMHGFVKLIADAETGEILGGACVGPVGGELIHEVIVAMHSRLTAAEFAAIPHYHPTLAEIWTYPAEEIADQINS